MRSVCRRGWFLSRIADPAQILAWDATRYLLDDLDPAEAAAFEHRLDHDQAAREALAAAVDLAGALALVAPEAVTAPVLRLTPPTAPQRNPWVGRGLVASLAASLLVAGFWGFAPKRIVGPNRPEPWRIAAAWAAFHQGEPGTTTDPDAPPALESVVLDPDAELTEVPAERPLPSWMVAAVAVVTPEPIADPTLDMDRDMDMDMGRDGPTDELNKTKSWME